MLRRWIVLGCVLLGSGGFAGQAQELRRGNVLKVAPFGLVGKLRLEYERSIGPQISVGISGSAYFGNITLPGRKGEVFGRVYFRHERREPQPPVEQKPSPPPMQQINWRQPVEIQILSRAPEGFYLQVKASYGEFELDQEFDYTELTKDANGFLVINGIETGTIRKKQHLTLKGGAFSAGYQALLGRNRHFALDFSLGIQQFPLPKSLGDDYETVTYENGYRIETTYTSFGFEREEWFIYGPGAYVSAHFAIGYAF